MAEEVKQIFGVDAAQALQTLQQLDSQFQKLGATLGTLGGQINSFNSAAGASFTRTGNVGASSFRQLATSGQSNLRTLRNAFEEAVSVSGRYTTSLQLASRIVFTQAVVSGFRHVRQSIEESIEASIAFQKQLAEIRSIDTDKIFGADLGDKLRQVSTQFNLPLPQVAAGAYEALSAQVLKTGEDFRFMSAAAAFSKGSLTSMDASVKGLAGALNAYGQTTEHVDRLASQFNETINLGTLRGEELAHQFGTIATLGRTLGVSQAELLASIAALTNAGVPVATAFTQVRGALTGLAKPTDELTKVMRENGIASGEQLVAAYRWGGALKFLREQTDGTTAGTAELFANQRAMLGVLNLGGTNANFYAQALERIEGVSSSLNKERAQQILASDSEQLTAKFNTLKNTLIPAGDALVSIANKGLDTAGVFRDYSAAVLQFTGDLLRGRPAIDQFGTAWQNLQALFGKDLTIGEFGGKIVSEIEIRQRQLDIFAKRRAEDDAERLKQEAARDAQLNKLRFQALDDFKARNQEELTEAQSAADKLIATEKAKVAELTRQIQQSRELLRQSPTRIADIQTRQERRNFDTRTADLPDPQRAFALGNLALEQVSKAESALAAAARSGSKEAIDRARALFEAAQATGEESKSLAESAGDRRGALFAARQLEEITARQLAGERSLAATTAARIPTLEQEKAKQQQKLDLITQATKELIKSSNLFDKQGNQLPADQLAKQAEARKRALASLAGQGVSTDVLAELSFKTEGSLQKLTGDIAAAMSQIDATPFQAAATALGQGVQPAQSIATAWNSAARDAERVAAASQSIATPGPLTTNPGPPHAFGGLIQAFADGGFVLPSYFNDGGSAAAKGTDTVPAMLAPREFVSTETATSRFFPQLLAMNAAGRQSNPVGDTSVNVHVGGIKIDGADNPQATGRAVFDVINRMQRRGAATLRKR